ncbi:hypothetical protein [Paenibacillus sp. 2003]|uniref:hypothetical protein n=1 Tax=Paenibacillus TaxID=44249 RepID=UPI002854B16B|nr:hypothetical protein [Paenibacillus sp. 2003]MDR6720879.1 hypothetical protein [Paenibacillus sp. 2003]
MNRIYDPTFEELRIVKGEIQSFVNDNFNPSSEHLKNYFINICKKIVLVKYLIRQLPTDYRYRALLSDLYYLLNSIELGELRYYYLNIRSIIEQSMRIVVDIADTTTITYVELMESVSGFRNTINHIREVNIGIIQDEYSKACLYVHGNSNAQMGLAEYYNTSFRTTKSIEGLETKLNQLVGLLKSVFSLIILSQAGVTDAAFHRRKSILRYLISDDNLVNYVILQDA